MAVFPMQEPYSQMPIFSAKPTLVLAETPPSPPYAVGTPQAEPEVRREGARPRPQVHCRALGDGKAESRHPPLLLFIPKQEEMANVKEKAHGQRRGCARATLPDNDFPAANFQGTRAYLLSTKTLTNVLVSGNNPGVDPTRPCPFGSRHSRNDMCVPLCRGDVAGGPQPMPAHGHRPPGIFGEDEVWVFFMPSQLDN